MNSMEVLLAIVDVMRDWPLAHRFERILPSAVEVDGKICGAWIAMPPFDHNEKNFTGGNTELRIECHNDVMFLLEIRLSTQYRGQGHGADLYDRACRIAWRLGLPAVSQYPSGKTFRGEERREYLLKRGWVADGGSVIRYSTPEESQLQAGITQEMKDWFGQGEIDVDLMLLSGVLQPAGLLQILNNLEDSPWKGKLTHALSAAPASVP